MRIGLHRSSRLFYTKGLILPKAPVVSSSARFGQKGVPMSVVTRQTKNSVTIVALA